MSEMIWSYVTEADYTVYGCWKVYKEILELVGENVPPSQMMYNYARQGLLVKGTKLTKETMRKVTAAELVVFLAAKFRKMDVQVPMKADKNQPELFEVTEPKFLDKDELVQL